MKRETAVIVKELIEHKKDIERLRVWKDKFNFLDVVFRNFVKALVISGLLYSFFTKDTLLMLLFIGVAIVGIGELYGKKEAD